MAGGEALRGIGVNSFLIRRLLMLIPVFLGITFLNFVLMNLLPGDAVDAMVNPRDSQRWTPEQIQARRISLGLDKPWPVRYVIWLKELGKGNLGYSYFTKKPVTEELVARIGATLRLQVVSFTVAILLGIALGVYSAIKQYTTFDYLFTLVTYVGISIPIFFTALIIIYIFAVNLRWFPTSGLRVYGGASPVLEQLWYMTLPAFTLAIGSWATIMRFCRTSMLEVLQQDFLRTARAKGLANRSVILHHALRNALLPVITIIGLSIPRLITGSILVETVFDWPGMGQYSVLSIGRRDYPVLMGVTVIFSLAVLLSNLLTDIAYAVADPRIRYDQTR